MKQTSLTIGCVLLAAGSSRRFGANKLLYPVEGAPLYRRALDTVPPELAENTVVVTRYPEIAEAAEARGLRTVSNPCPESGLSSSVRLGLAPLLDCDAVLFLVADQPYLTRASVARLLSLYRSAPHRIAAAAAGERRGMPSIFPRSFFLQLMALTGDTGGREIIRACGDEISLLPLSPRELEDLDRPPAGKQ